MRGRLAFFLSTLTVTAVFGILAIVVPETVTLATEALTTSAYTYFDDLLSVAVSGFFVLAVILALSPFGRVRLGPPGERPEFHTLSWLAMMFAAGMGAGLLFFGVAEPMSHYSNELGQSTDAARAALSVTLFHWGFQAWGIYCMAALVIAYFAFRRGRPYLAGAPLREVFRGWGIGQLAAVSDFMAVIAVAMGLGISIALGTMQVHSGLSFITDLPRDSTPIALAILWLIVLAYIASATTSLSKGVQWLSNINMVLMVLIMLAVLVLGPTAFIAEGLWDASVGYVADLPAMTARLHPYTADQGFYEGWSLTYFVWWASWAPFVGIFIARISRGRTIREFVFGVILVPTLFTVCSFGVFGNAAIFEETLGQGGLAELASADKTAALFTLFERLPFALPLSVTAAITVFIFVVTSGDSGTFVLGMLTSGGSESPPRVHKVAWGLALGVLATGFMLAGDLDVVTQMALAGAIPFIIVVGMQAVALVLALRQDAVSGVYSDAPRGLRALAKNKTEAVGLDDAAAVEE